MKSLAGLGGCVGLAAFVALLVYVIRVRPRHRR